MQTKEENKQSKGQIVVAFPGMGKTTYALHNPGAIDLDFGNFRAANGIAKDKQNVLYPAFSRLVKYYYNDGYIVLTNDPGVLPLIKQFAEGHIKVVLPSDPQDLVLRVKEREKKRSINREFPLVLEKHIDEWLNDWERVAVRYHIPVIKSQYLEV